MINSNSGFVDFVKSSEPDLLIDTDSGNFSRTYNVSLAAPQLVQYTLGEQIVTEQLISGLIRETGYLEAGKLVITYTSVQFAALTLALAVFLALSIDWDPRQPIKWVLSARSDSYNGHLTSPIFSDLVSIEQDVTDDISQTLSQF